MQELRDAYSNPPENSVPYVSPTPRRVGTDFYSRDAPDFKTAKEVMQEITGGDNLSDRIMSCVRWSDSAGNHPKAEAICSYFSKLLKGRGCYGNYVVHYIKMNMEYICVQFKKTDADCPVCRSPHPSYNFQYKVKPGVYGGWKCWKTDEWATQYEWEDMSGLFSK